MMAGCICSAFFYLCTVFYEKHTYKQKNGKRNKGKSYPFAEARRLWRIIVPGLQHGSLRVRFGSGHDWGIRRPCARTRLLARNEPDRDLLREPCKGSLRCRQRVCHDHGHGCHIPTLLVFAEAGKTIVMSNHLFGNTFWLITTTLARLGEKAQIADFSDLARLLLQVPQVKRVNYPGLQLQKPFGAMLTIDLEPSRSATTSSTDCA